MINEYDDEDFLDLIEDGNLAECKGYYKEFKTDIRAYNDCAFMLAASNGHLDVCKWLYSLSGVDVHANDDYAFAHGSTEVKEWLNSLDK